MNKLIIVVMFLGLLVISGCGIEPGKSLAGQAGNRGGSGSGVVLSDSGKTCREFYYMESDEKTISGPYVCTTYQNNGEPWCATRVTTPGNFYVTGGKYKTDWDTCKKAYASTIPPTTSKTGGLPSGGNVVIPGSGKISGDGPSIGGEVISGTPSEKKEDISVKPGVNTRTGPAPTKEEVVSSDTPPKTTDKTVESETSCITKSKPNVKVGLWKGDSACIDLLASKKVYIYGDKASLNSESEISEQFCEGIVNGVVVVRDPQTKELSWVKWKNPILFLSGWSGICEKDFMLSHSKGPSTLDEVKTSCQANPNAYGGFFIQECDGVKWTLPCNKETQFGCDCADNSQCDIGYCVQRDPTRPWFGKMCSQFCTTGCPENVNTKGQGLKCVQTGIGADVAFICSGLQP